MTVGFVVNATKQGVRIHDLEVAVEGYFDNIRKWAGVEDEGNPGYGNISAKCYVRADADEDTLRKSGGWPSRAHRSPSRWSTPRRSPPTSKRSADGNLRIRRLGSGAH